MSAIMKAVIGTYGKKNIPKRNDLSEGYLTRGSSEIIVTVEGCHRRSDPSKWGLNHLQLSTDIGIECHFTEPFRLDSLPN